jgi:protocatechuate 3,4-dioxygenase beta subunit
MPLDLDRRLFLALLYAGAAGVATGDHALGQQLAPTPACGDDDEPTPAQSEGPFFVPNSPERSDLREPGLAGTPLLLTGLVATRSCRPLPGALVELWHADDAGSYDLAGFRCRGHQFTDSSGAYRFSTILPGLYPGRTRHFHLKFQAASRPVLTTQFYFPGEPLNAVDGLFNPELVMTMIAEPEPAAWYTTVLDLP